ncbi:MAG TPA: hypothetical protein VM120_20230 [Bryobacteraceae bacterium]|nr:hypothetical protein [Bryobacteraceae bacterium]
MCKTLLFAAMSFWAAMPAAAAGLRGGGCAVPNFGLAFGTINSLMATPGTISFPATNPNAGVVSGSSSATISWTVQNGSPLQSWTISVQASASTFTGCSTVPVSAVSVACASASVGGGGGTGSCGGAMTLSTVAQQVAAGVEGDGTQSYLVLINYTLAESWRYVANSSCTLTLTYTVNAP